jgi:tight adherence protein B
VNFVPLVLAAAAAFAVWLAVTGMRGGRVDRAARHRRRAVHGEATPPGGQAARRSAMSTLSRGRRSALRSARRRAAEARAGLIRSVALTSAIALIMALVGYTVFGLIGAAAGTGAGIILPTFIQRQKAGRRQSKINGRLPDLLNSISGALRAGQTFVQALDSAGREVGEPLQGELVYSLRELELGVPMDEALESLRARVHDQDFDLVIDAVLIQRQIGGDLAEVLSNISVTVRERIRIRGEVKSLTGQARLSGWVLSLLPIVVGCILYMLSPEYMSPLFTESLGRVMIAVGVCAGLVGMFLIRRIANVKV